MSLSLRLVLPAIALSLAATTTLSRAVVVPFSQAPTIDSDGDGVPDIFDNAPDVSNPAQFDTDADGIGDVIDPTPALSNPNLGDPGLHLFHPATITAGSHALINYTLTLSTPPGGWGHIDLDLNSDLVVDAFYFGPLDTANIYTIDIDPSIFTDAGWDLNTSGTYNFQAKAFGPGSPSDNWETESITVIAATPEPATLSLLTLAPLLLTRRKLKSH